MNTRFTAVFNSPVVQSEHVAKAVAAAMHLIKKAEKLSRIVLVGGGGGCDNVEALMMQG